jgi:hypothetical protein
MDFERSNILKPILDELAAKDQALFLRMMESILMEFSTTVHEISSREQHMLADAFKEELTKRRDDLLAEMHRVLEGAPVEDFENLRESLSTDLAFRLEAAASLATSQFPSDLVVRETSPYPVLSVDVISDHLNQIKPRLRAEIDLFSIKLHDSQRPRIFLRAGEVFAGNRAARRIFTAAKQSLDIIDTYLGPEAFDLLEVTQQSVKIRLISDKARPPTKQAYNLFNQQYGKRVEFRLCDPKEIHDRFIILDDRSALHLGASIKDLGKSDSVIDAAQLEAHSKRFVELWLKAAPVT